MKTLNLVICNRKYKAYISPDGYGRYQYMLYEIVPKKHWWSSSNRYIGIGIIWNNINDEIINRIEKEIKKENELNCLAEQFDKL